MSEMYEYEFSDGSILTVEQEQNPENPREWDNLSQMICFHNRYQLGDKHSYKSNDYSGWDELKKKIESDHDVSIIFPVYLYDHSGITVSTEPFSCPWDSGQVGWIFCTKQQIMENFGIKRITKKHLDIVRKVLIDELEQYDQYLRGEVYLYYMNDESAIGGFYGWDIIENGIADEMSPEHRLELIDGTAKKETII